MFFFSRLRGFLVLGFAMWPLLPLLPLHADGLLGSLAGPRVRVGPLAVDGQAAPVAEPLVAADLDLSLDVLGHVAAKVTLDLEVPVDVLADPDDLLLGEVPDLGGSAHAAAVHDVGGPGGADAVDVAKR